MDTIEQGDSWTRGQVSVRADTVQDIIQNYTVRIQRSAFTLIPWWRGTPGPEGRSPSGLTLSKTSYRLYTDTMAEGDSWTRGQVSVRTDIVQDIIQNYTVRNQGSVFAQTPW
jgi:hypothetical protein